MNYTGKFATTEETKEIQDLIQKAQSTPVIALSTRDALSGNDFATRAWRQAKEGVHEMALAHGLPEIAGFYGATEEGEFVGP
jgi:hypothetical protein